MATRNDRNSYGQEPYRRQTVPLRNERQQQQEQPAQKSRTHSSYEEAIARSNQRMSNLRGDSRRIREANVESQYNDYAQRGRAAQERQVNRQHDTANEYDRSRYSSRSGVQHRAAQRQSAPRITDRFAKESYVQQSDHSVRQLQTKGAPGNFLQGGYNNRRQGSVIDQISTISSPRDLLIRVAIIAVLLIAIVVRVNLYLPQAAETKSLQATTVEVQAEAGEMNSTNSKLQEQIDSMDDVIKAYNDKKNE